ncbi:MAG: hypothetical protein QOK05_1909 [Chloroflexota bacterium]|nr:hypothetical protein [Chloroflexota bacterium]
MDWEQEMPLTQRLGLNTTTEQVQGSPCTQPVDQPFGDAPALDKETFRVGLTGGSKLDKYAAGTNPDVQRVVARFYASSPKPGRGNRVISICCTARLQGP